MKRKQESASALQAEIRSLSQQLGSPQAQKIWGAKGRKALITADKRHQQLLAKSREASIRRKDKFRSSAHHY